jgi:hypothetical protein
MASSVVSRCCYRHSVRGHGAAEDAICQWLVEATGIVAFDADCRVPHHACAACCETDPPSPGAPNPVLASLLFSLATRLMEQGGVPGCSAEQASVLAATAEGHLPFCRVEPATNWSCDVVVCCTESTAQAERSILSILEQDRAIPIVHLVDDGGAAAPLVRRFTRHWNVVVHHNPTPRGLFAALHSLLPELRSEFVAVHATDTISHRDRIATSVSQLVERGAEIFGAPLATPSGPRVPSPYRGLYCRDIPWQTLVFRRACLIDMGGIADRARDADAELVYRARCERRRFVIGEAATVTCMGALPTESLGPAPAYEIADGSLRTYALGFPMESVESDVILPFHGHLAYVREAVASVLEQTGAEAVVHLIDDASLEDTDAFLRSWATHPRVRTYRNVRNVGQFASFNNVVPYLETRWVAVQDGDDISRPERLHFSGNFLRLSGADIFGGATRHFCRGADDDASGGPLAALPEPRVGRSSVPMPGARFFLQNPTAMIRASTFEALHGFSDYGDLERNKCGLDTEFYIRAYYAGARFAISQAIVVDYRIHAASAVHNAQTGWGSPARLWSETENHRRFYLFQQGPFDPRVFGSLGNGRGVTVRLSRP